MSDVFDGLSDVIERASRSSQQTTAAPREINPRDARNVILPFDLSDNKQTVDKWIVNINSLKELHHLGDPLTSSFMIEQLRGLAKDWDHGLVNIPLLWKEWQVYN